MVHENIKEFLFKLTLTCIDFEFIPSDTTWI